MNNGQLHNTQPVTKAERLGEAIHDLLGLPALMQELNSAAFERMDALERRLEELKSTLERLTRLQEDSNESIQLLYQKHELLEDAGRRVSRLTDEHFAKHIVTPLARHLIDYLDLAEAMLENAEVQQQEALLSGVYDLLAHYEVETMTAKAGEPFDPAIMKPLMRIPTSEVRLTRLVHSMIRRGYRHQQRILRPVEVRLYRVSDVAA